MTAFLGPRKNVGSRTFGVALALALVGVVAGDLTGKLVDDADNMANIVGAKETLSLVDFKLHQEQGKRESLATKAKDAKDIAGKKYKEMQDAEEADAKVTNLLRHLKSKLAIDKDAAIAKQAVALKAEAVAKKMELLAQSTASDAASALEKQHHDQTQLASTEAKAEVTSRERRKAEEERRTAEEEARRTAARLADADTGVQKLLRRHSKLEKLQLEEETRQTTRLADAFREDARRQQEFKSSLLAQRRREEEQREAVAGREREAERRAREREAAGREAGRELRERGETRVASLAHALLRANPELQELVPRSRSDGGQKEEEGAAGWSGEMEREEAGRERAEEAREDGRGALRSQLSGGSRYWGGEREEREEREDGRRAERGEERRGGRYDAGRRVWEQMRGGEGGGRGEAGRRREGGGQRWREREGEQHSRRREEEREGGREGGRGAEEREGGFSWGGGDHGDFADFQVPAGRSARV